MMENWKNATWGKRIKLDVSAKRPELQPLEALDNLPDHYKTVTTRLHVNSLQKNFDKTFKSQYRDNLSRLENITSAICLETDGTLDGVTKSLCKIDRSIDKEKAPIIDIQVPSDQIYKFKDWDDGKENILSIVNIGVSNPVSDRNEVDDEKDDTLFRHMLSNESHPFTDEDVLIAVIDTGIGFANSRFRLSSGKSRVEYFLDMSRVDTAKYENVQCYKEWEHGYRTWNKSDIDQLLSEFNGEDTLVYQAMGLIDPRRGENCPLLFGQTHGTHVLNLATGYDCEKEPDLAEKCRILAIQLPPEEVLDTTGAMTYESFKYVTKWLELCARVISERIERQKRRRIKSRYLPLFVNFSFGIFAESTDYEATIENEIENFTTKYRGHRGKPHCEFVVPAGNGYADQATALVTCKPDQKRVIPWRIFPDDKTSCFIHIWSPQTNDPATRSKWSIKVRPPQGSSAASPRSQLFHSHDWKTDNTIYARIYHQQVKNKNGFYQELVTVAVRPTESLDPSLPVAPSGIWGIEIKNNPEASCDYEVKIQRGDSVSVTRQGGRQSYIDDPAYRRFDPVSGRFLMDSDQDKKHVIVQRDNTINAYGSTKALTVIGGFRGSDGKPAEYSGSGPVFRTKRKGPDYSAATDESPTIPGILSSGTMTGSVARMTGTSVAVPAYVRALAESTVRDEILVLADKKPYSSELILKRHGKGRLIFRKEH